MIIPKNNYLKEVGIYPQPTDDQINTAGLDLKIGHDCVLVPGGHFVAKTLETLTLPEGVVGIVYPRSSLNRKGITLDATGIVDPGYSGHLVMPLTNNTDEIVIFKKGQRIAQIIFHRMEVYTGETRKSQWHEPTDTNAS